MGKDIFKLWLAMWFKPQDVFPGILRGGFWVGTIFLGVITQCYISLVSVYTELIKVKLTLSLAQLMPAVGMYMLLTVVTFFLYCGILKLLITPYSKGVEFKDIIKAVVWAGVPLTAGFVLFLFHLSDFTHASMQNIGVLETVSFVIQAVFGLWSFLLSLDCIKMACNLHSRWNAFCGIFVAAFLTKVIVAVSLVFLQK